MKQQSKVSFVLSFAKELFPISFYFIPLSNIQFAHIWKRKTIIILVMIHLHSDHETLKKMFCDNIYKVILISLMIFQLKSAT